MRVHSEGLGVESRVEVGVLTWCIDMASSHGRSRTTVGSVLRVKLEMEENKRAKSRAFDEGN